MNTSINKRMRLRWLMLLCFAAAMSSFGQTLSSLTKNSEGWYVITSDADFEQFRDSVVAIGNPYANALLAADITVDKPISTGAEHFHYRGTFDGQGHTVTLNNMINTSTEAMPWGLFQYTKPGCVIRNLKVSGSLKSDYPYVGSIVGDATSTRIENCISDAEVENYGAFESPSETGDGVGGLLGVSHGENFIENCAFIGTITAPYCIKVRGLVGANVHKVSITTCYVMATFNVPELESHDQFTDYRVSKYNTFLNNYYYNTNKGVKVANMNNATEIQKLDDITEGILCWHLNETGKNGVVWYQHGDYPYPFKGEKGKFVIVDGGIYYDEACNHEFYKDTHICLRCGAIEEGYQIEPLQQINPASDQYPVYIGYLKYSLDEGNATAKVIGFTNKDDIDGNPPSIIWSVRAAHIPETIYANGKAYTVTKIGNGAFTNSEMEYCYIPKTVTNIEDNAFKGCSKLAYVHIAEAPGGSADKAMAMADKLFNDCPLTKVYIGRDIKWSDYSPFSYKDGIKDVFFGPRVTRIGNFSGKELFKDGKNFARVYFMGDEQTLNMDDLNAECCEGMSRATDFYINRTMLKTDKLIYSVMSNDNGVLDQCVNATFGPFVKYVCDDMFGGRAIKYNRILKLVDFTNAYRLEEIRTYAFNECNDAVFTGLHGQYPLKKIGNDAFYNCDNLYAIDFGKKLETIESKAFNDCDKLAYLVIPAYLDADKIGEKAFADCAGLGALDIEDSDLPIKMSTLKSNFSGCSVLSTIHFGRQINYDIDEDSPFSSASATLLSVAFGPKVKTIRRMFSGIESLRNVAFKYSPDPISFENSPEYDLYTVNPDDGKGLTSLYIDRSIIDKKEGTHYYGYGWGSLVNSISEITFGPNIEHIYSHEWYAFGRLRTINIPSNIKSIGNYAFHGAASLITLMIMGAPEIGEHAFDVCYSLENIVFANDGVKIGKEAFCDSKKIKEILLVTDGKNPCEGAANAFNDLAYDNTALYCTADTRSSKVEFSVAPWKFFKNHPYKRDNDYDGNQESHGYYEHASIERTISANQYEMVYIPFEWDSYHFGANAEVYSLNIHQSGGNTSFEDSKEAVKDHETFTNHNLKVTKLDLQSVKTLPRGIYAIKSEFADNAFNAWRNLYINDEIYVDNSFRNIYNSENKAVFSHDSKNADYQPTNSAYLYVFEDGVIKMLNAPHTVKPGWMLYAAGAFYDIDKLITNVTCDGNDDSKDELNGVKTLLTSKMSVPFHELLEGYATFYNEKYHVVAPNWCTVYAVTGESDGSVTLEEIKDKVITAGQAVIIRTTLGEAIGAEDFMTYVTDASAQSEEIYARNLLRGVSEDTPVEEVSSAGYVYVLSTNSDATKTGFYKFSNGKTLSAGKAYLLPSDFSAEAKVCLFAFDDVTGISDVEIDNGEAAIYDLLGRRLENTSAKGVYIINNKKALK